MNRIEITQAIKYLGAEDTTIDLFESQYKVPQGVTYNSYLILDEKTAILDTTDKRVSSEWLNHVRDNLHERTVDYLIVSHMEPDHAANIELLLQEYPDVTLVGNQKTFDIMEQFFNISKDQNKWIVKEGDTLSLGKHQLTFYMAPMVHWPEVMVTYECTEKILFSADGFGMFGTMESLSNWTEEGRRYYINIVGKYGVQVQTLLKKLNGLDVSMICPLHGPVLKENLSYYIGKYNTWSSYKPEEDGILVVYASIHGNTEIAAKQFAEILKEKTDLPVVVRDLSRTDLSKNIADAFRYSRLVAAAATYDGGMFPCMEDFLLHLKAKNYQKRTVGLIENGSWAPQAGKRMKAVLDEMKQLTICDTMVHLRSTMKDIDIQAMSLLAEEVLQS